MSAQQYIVTVRQDDIVKGVRGLGHLCPIARALRRQFPGSKIHANRNFAEIGDERCAMPTSARLFIESYDAGLFVAPFSFALSMPGVAK